MGQWLYDRRDPVSWWFALTLMLSVLWSAHSWRQPQHRIIEQEWQALLETEKPHLASPPKTNTPSVSKVTPHISKAEPPAQHSPMVTAPVAEPTAAMTGHASANSQTTNSSVTTTPSATTPSEPVKVNRSNRAIPYEALLLGYLERIKRYPSSREARISKPQGVVRLWLVISRQGTLLDAGIADSSGSNLLDGEALRTVRSGSFPAFPEDAYDGVAQHRFTVNLKYDIEG